MSRYYQELECGCLVRIDGEGLIPCVASGAYDLPEDNEEHNKEDIEKHEHAWKSFREIII